MSTPRGHPGCVRSEVAASIAALSVQYRRGPDHHGKEMLKESELGNLVSDIFCAATEDCDFAIVNPGMFRT